MNKLIKQKEQIDTELKQKKKELETIYAKNNEYENKLENLKQKRKVIQADFEKYKELIINKKTLFKDLILQIDMYKQHRLIKVRETYETKYQDILDEINKIHWNYNLQIFESFDKLRKCKSLAKIFKNLKKEITKFEYTKYTSLNEHITQEVSKNTEMHNMIYLIKFIVQFELYFKKEIFVECMNNFVLKRYEYHFASKNETNRLDKPEWILNFFEKKIEEVAKYYKIYINLHVASNLDKHFFLQQIGETIAHLINLRISEIDDSSSTQKQIIFVNFNFFLTNFISFLEKNFQINVRDKFTDFQLGLKAEEERAVIFKLQNIHKLDFTEWFLKYEEVFKGILDLKKRSLDINMDIIVNNIIEFNLIFIDSMRYINRKEISVLIYLYNMFEELKESIQFLLEEFYQENPHLEENFDNLLLGITKFNLENFKLIRSIFDNDINNIINLNFFFINDLNTILDEYKNCKGYAILKSTAVDLINKHLYHSLTTKKINLEEYKEYMKLFKHLKVIFDTKKWESRECMKCVKAIFENNTIENKQMKQIRKLYYESI